MRPKQEPQEAEGDADNSMAWQVPAVDDNGGSMEPKGKKRKQEYKCHFCGVSNAEAREIYDMFLALKVCRSG